MNAHVSIVDTTDLTLDEATAIVGRALAEAHRLGIVVSVAVCGGQGRLVAFSKMDGAGCMSARHAIGKAVASAISGEPSEFMPRPEMTSTAPSSRAKGPRPSTHGAVSL